MNIAIIIVIALPRVVRQDCSQQNTLAFIIYPPVIGVLFIWNIAISGMLPSLLHG